MGGGTVARVTHPHHDDGSHDAIAAERVAAERQQLRATMNTLAAELGIDANASPPAAVADLVNRFGPATYMAARSVAYDPECLRWLALVYRYWAMQLVDYADAGEAETAALLADLEHLLRQPPG